MFRISKFNNHDINYIEVLNSSKSAYSKINLNHGGCLQELILDNNHLIQDMSPLVYEDTYASSILFPFANRIKDGIYKFENKIYQLEINEKGLNHALHGLVYNKDFTLVDEKVSETAATVKLEYHDTNGSQGFPFSYSIFLDYTLRDLSLEISVLIKNTSPETFPFTIGWHPYFFSDDLKNSYMIFDSNKKMQYDNRNITTGIIEIENLKVFKINDQELNECYLLNSNVVNFQTSKYLMTLKSSEKDSFLQLYTPPKKNTIAIEPTTGVSDSFNNEIGLKTLKSNESYSINWTVNIDSK